MKRLLREPLLHFLLLGAAFFLAYRLMTPTADRGAQAPQEAVPQQPVPQQEDPQATDPVLAGPRTTAPLSDDGWRTVPQGSAR